MTPQEKGRLFEKDLARYFGLRRVPGSGNMWHSKLDLTSGRLARWSLKYTEQEKINLKKVMDEAVNATEAIGASGEIPMVAIRLDSSYDLVVMRKEDFALFQEGETKVINRESKTSERSARARIPILQREKWDLQENNSLEN